jgi:hypothetical protein
MFFDIDVAHRVRVIMPEPYPPPPTNSFFVLGTDEAGWPQVSWSVTSFKKGRTEFDLILLIHFCFGAFLVAVFWEAWQAGKNSQTMICAGFIWFFFGCALLLKFGLMVCSPNTPVTLSLTDDALIYFPGFTRSDTRSIWSLIHKNPPRIIHRFEIGAINLDRIGKRHRLYIDVGADRIEIGRQFKELEREWLARVLRMWADENKPSKLREPPSTNIKPAL